jgi:transcription-repair coupling factor (superfamily II helicase)
MSAVRLAEVLRAQGHARTAGIRGGARGHVLAQVTAKLGLPLLCITADEDRAQELERDLAFFFGGGGTLEKPRVLRLPADDVPPWDLVVPDSTAQAERLGALFHLSQATGATAVVTSWRAIARKVMPPSVMNALSELVGEGQDHGRDALAQKLAGMGYLASPLVEDPGTFSLRGDILDVFPPLHTHPIRLEFFGDTVESMRTFDPGSQRTLEKVPVLHLLPARELFFSDATKAQAEKAIRAVAELSSLPTSKVRERLDQVKEGVNGAGLMGLWPAFFEGGLATVFDYLPLWMKKSPLVWLDEPSALAEAAEELGEEVARSHQGAVERGELTLPPEQHYLSPPEVHLALGKFPRVEGGGLTLDAGGEGPVSFAFGETKSLRDQLKAHHGEEGVLKVLIDQLERWRDEGVSVAVACAGKGQLDRLERLLKDRDVKLSVHSGPFEGGVGPAVPGVLAHLFNGDLSAGFVDRDARLAVLSDEDIFGPRARRRSGNRRSDAAVAASFRDLKAGDLVVHSEFGVARYGGMTSMEVLGVPNEFLVLQYAGKDKVYLPVSRMRLLSKFAGGDPGGITLDRLGTDSWDKTKERVREKLLQLAAELLQLYAQRKAHPGFSFSPPDRYYRQFEADFEFDETPDQQRAIDDTIADMQKTDPMDRLICGDVGYGKTEVAMRATFKAVLDHKQVAVLVPTTLLAHQHFQTFTRRFAGYPVSIDVVSSLRKPPEVREVLTRAREGKVDVLIGTHKLLGGEVSFKDLGLLIVDEEQRFGVKQKEALKKFKAQVDVLTLSATPIPRTLNMAMGGLRDLSMIVTPPTDRRAIRTFVNRFNPGQVREAVLREVQRGGQVFFVHNRVGTIYGIERYLKELIPEVSIAVAHGQMPEGALEKVMLQFVEKKVQVLLCTSIIESGIDIPSANTMIVSRADTFGLAQLYQLRGRVGRSRERAYAYLMVPARRKITKDAEKRLEVLQAFSELGAGFNIASHDLEIRGAGNLLGDEQSGAIEAVGFDLYTQMLEEAVAELKGEPPRVEVEPDVNLPLAAFLPEPYVPDMQQRLVLYKRFSSAQSDDELADLRAELLDRYGDAPEEVDHLQELMTLKLRMRKLALRSLDWGPGRIAVTLGADARLDPMKTATLVQKSKGVYRLTPDMKLVAKVEVQAPPSLPGQKPKAPAAGEVVAAARKMLQELERCARPN